MTIRRIRESELHQLIELYRHYVTQENLPSLAEDTIRGIWRQIQSNPDVNYFVLEADDRIAAACILSITPSFIRGGVAYGLIEHVVTHPGHRRKGYGETLINHALGCAWENGCTEVMLLSGSQNKIAHAMYEKLGFDRHRKTGFIMFKPGETMTRPAGKPHPCRDDPMSGS